MVDNLKRAAELCEPAGLTMVLEPLNHWTDHAGVFLTGIPQAFQICRAVASPSCKILDDLYYQQITEGNLIPNMDKAWDEIAYIQVGDNPGRKEPTTGEINYHNVFRHLKGKGYRGIVVPDKTFEAPCPEQCPCGGKVGAEGSIDLYQVDIPPIQPETWKFVVGHGHCQECGRRVRGQHPLLISKAFEVGTVHFGPRLLAFAAFQKMICGVSYDKTRLGFEQMLGFPVARSTLCRAMQRLARRAKPTRDALVEALRASPVVYADETGWKQGGRRVWLWVFTNLRETVYEILPGRGFEQAASVLGRKTTRAPSG